MIIVCGLQDASEQVTRHAVARVVSILSPPVAFPQFEQVTADNHLRLDFHDIAAATPGLTAPGMQDVRRLIEFLGDTDRAAPLLIHCWAGISRSTASAYIASCLFQPAANEDDLARALRRASPTATPNPMLIALADEALGRDGRMRAAIAAIGRGADAYGGSPFRLEV
jgi:predicted protein tyrosine phosphatase